MVTPDIPGGGHTCLLISVISNTFLTRSPAPPTVLSQMVEVIQQGMISLDFRNPAEPRQYLVLGPENWFILGTFLQV